MQWKIVVKDGIVVEVTEVVGVEGSRVLFERYLPLHDIVLKRYRVASHRATSKHHRHRVNTTTSTDLPTGAPDDRDLPTD